MKGTVLNRIILVFAAPFLWFAPLPVSATVTPFSLAEFQTVDYYDNFPADGDNNIDKFDTDGTTAGTVAPFATTAYVRSSTSSTLDRRVQLFLQFELAVMSDDTIVGATLEFSAYSLNDTENASLSVSQLQDDWDAAGMIAPPMYNPNVEETVTGGSVISGTGLDLYDGGFGAGPYRNTTSYSIDVTSIVQNWQNGDWNDGFHLDLGDSASQNQGLGIDIGTLVLNVDQVPNPSVTLSTASSLVDAPYLVDVAFNETVTGLEITDFDVINGTASDLLGMDDLYTVLITPTNAGNVEVTLPADQANASPGGEGNLASNTLVTPYSVPVAPSVFLSTTSPLVTGPYYVFVDFSEPVTGLEDSDFVVTNGTASELFGFAEFYSLLITPTAIGEVTVMLPAGSVVDDTNGLANEASEPLITSYDSAISSLLSMLNGDLNLPATFLGSSRGDRAISFDPATNTVSYDGIASTVGNNEWIETGSTRGFTYSADGGAGGIGDGAWIDDPAVSFNQKPRAVFYFADDGKQSTGPLDFGIDVLFEDNTVDNALQLLVELYAWNDGQLAPGLSWGGPVGNDPTYNVTDLGDAATILNTQVLATSVADATWETVSLGTVDVGTGYDNYAWRIGVMGATPTDTFAFDNVTVTAGSAGSSIEVTDITRAANGDVTLDFSSPAGNVDVYRSTDLQTWAITANGTNVAPGSYLDTTASGLAEAFYTLVPTGSMSP